METTEKYYNRELSWLTFNHLVLDQIKDLKLPLYERVKFLAIYASNLDEFYRVRVAYWQSLLDLGEKNKKKLDYDPEDILEKIKSEVSIQLKEYYDLFNNTILPELNEEVLNL